MGIFYELNGDAVLTGDADHSRTETVPGPKNSPEQIAEIVRFFSLEPPPEDPEA